MANESKTLATITFQNFFRLYDKLSGMTGTAMTEEDEFSTIYDLDIVEIPTNKPVVRVDHPDVVYKTEAGKYRAVIEQIEECHEKGQPVLVGTVSIEKSELLSAHASRARASPTTCSTPRTTRRKRRSSPRPASWAPSPSPPTWPAAVPTSCWAATPSIMAKADLRKAGIRRGADRRGHRLRRDRQRGDPRRPQAVCRGSRPSTRTRSRPEAEKVRAAGGLFILGTERHESRRIDNQLRGRAGRQGDPGETRFYLSLEDDIMRLFGAERVP